MTAEELDLLATSIDDSFFLIGVGVLIYELLRGLANNSLGKQRVLDMLTSVSTQLPSFLIQVFVIGFAYLGYLKLSDSLIGWTFSINGWTILAAVLACDFVYYWEHRCSHVIRLLWTQHAVHHSSRFMNIAVAARFGPLEGVASAVLHLPLIIIGFPPALVFFGIVTVLAYQTWLHTETIGRLGMLEKLLNTPSNHRVHHGCDEKYLDKNYGGILIIWDRMFGSYQSEEETPRYGLKRDFNALNPFHVCFSEIPGLYRDVRDAPSVKQAMMHLFAHPSWTPESGNQTPVATSKIPSKVL
ncbi:MAG: sterol desaturase family protein [Pseudomonadota bacterium]